MAPNSLYSALYKGQSAIQDAGLHICDAWMRGVGEIEIKTVPYLIDFSLWRKPLIYIIPYVCDPQLIFSALVNCNPGTQKGERLPNNI